MNHLLDDEEMDTPAQPEHELTLSTASILGIFFGLVLLCGAFFGFGYKMGSHRTAPPADAAVIEATPATGANFSAFKPAAGSPAGSPAPVPPVAVTTPAPAPTETDTPDAPPEAAPIVHPTATTHPAAPAVAPTAPTGTIFVQVAAVSHKEDADLLVSALKAKGYPVAAYGSPDKLFHIQVGPFANRTAAESTRQRLLADGYQPILK
jgi:cell division septation protein DedD